MSDEHKKALAVDRDESRAIRQYLEAVEAHKPRRGRRRTVEGMQTRLERIEDELLDADPLSRVHLAQERINLHAELASRQEAVDLSSEPGPQSHGSSPETKQPLPEVQLNDVIEGTCRYLVADRMDITGARWSVEGAEAVLELRAVQANGDFDEYWAYHLDHEQQRVHESRYADGIIPLAA